MKKIWYKLFIYSSLIFVVISLYKTKMLNLPNIYSFQTFIVSLILLFLGFVGEVISWKKVLSTSGHDIPFSVCLAGTGLSIFGKYIPGKLWVIVGRAAYISKKTGDPLDRMSTISFISQLITLWSGLLLGAIGLMSINGFYKWGWLVILLFVGLTIGIFSNSIQTLINSITEKVLGKNMNLPRIPSPFVFKVLPWFIAFWGLWVLAFYLFVVSLTKSEVNWEVSLIFPFAATIGIMTLFSPGGLGTREAIMVGCLALAGFLTPEATTIAAASRIWFLIGEVFIFVSGWITNKNIQIGA